MKKSFAAILFPLAALFLLSGCNYPTEEDFIPEKMGAADDGLWLYRSDLTRTRSDGSGREELPLVAEINGGEAELGYWLAETDAHTLFYVLTQGEGEEEMSALRVYDYETKRDEEIIPAFSGEFISPAGLPVRAGGDMSLPMHKRRGRRTSITSSTLKETCSSKRRPHMSSTKRAGFCARSKSSGTWRI